MGSGRSLAITNRSLAGINGKGRPGNDMFANNQTDITTMASLNLVKEYRLNHDHPIIETTKFPKIVVQRHQLTEIRCI
jgi:hypothetical protein